MEHGLLKHKASKGLRPNKTDGLKKKLHLAFDTRRESKNPVVLALRAGLPVLIGRKCEPLCPSEDKYHATLEALKILNEYSVTAIMETKGVTNPRNEGEYFANLSGVQVSVTPGTRTIHDSLEPSTPTFEERFSFAKALKDVGLWVGLTAEPIIPTVNDKNDYIVAYASMAVWAGVDHVNFGAYRVHNPKLANSRMRLAGYDLGKILTEKARNWKKIGLRIFETLKSCGLKVSSPDWDLFYAQNSCESCCGLDQFGVHHCTFQKACEILCKTSTVQWSEIASHCIFGEKYLNKFREIWNGKGGYYNLADISGVYRVGYDEDGNWVYGRGKDLKEAFG